VSLPPLSPELVREALQGPAAFAEPSGEGLGPLLPAAVIVPLVLTDSPHVMVVVRAAELREHAGELGFPGGKREAHDASLADAAVRELSEETGLTEPAILGKLTPVPVVTGRYVIHPFVASIDARSEPRTSPEIAEVLRMPIEPWLDGRAQLAGAKTEWRGVEMVLPHFEIQGRVLYGASALIFYDLLFRIAQLRGQSLPPPRVEQTPPWLGRYGRKREDDV
jgi:8-oxo-dGTP pyrophosphatase MutT (NUDIX family)